MNAKNLFTFAGVTYGLYALMLLVLPRAVMDALYASTAVPESAANLYLGGSLLGLAVICLMVRSQPLGAATKAILAGISIDHLHAVYVTVSTMAGAEFSPGNIMDLGVSLIVGFGGAYLFMQSGKHQPSSA